METHHPRPPTQASLGLPPQERAAGRDALEPTGSHCKPRNPRRRTEGSSAFADGAGESAQGRGPLAPIHTFPSNTYKFRYAMGRIPAIRGGRSPRSKNLSRTLWREPRKPANDGACLPVVLPS